MAWTEQTLTTLQRTAFRLPSYPENWLPSHDPPFWSALLRCLCLEVPDQHDQGNVGAEA